jgi:hypothetical protein
MRFRIKLVGSKLSLRYSIGGIEKESRRDCRRVQVGMMNN